MSVNTVSEKDQTDDNFKVSVNEEGKIIDFISENYLEPKPEEFVRQSFLRILHYEYGYPKKCLAREVGIQYGSKEKSDKSGNPIRADIVIYSDQKACVNRDQGKIEIIIECKSPTEKEGYNQLVSYIFNTSANGAVWYNSLDDIKYFRRQTKPNNKLIEWIGIPRYKQPWDALGTIKKSSLKRPKDIKGLLRRCHNRLHGRGHDGDENDLTMDMVRIILAKAKDEEKSGEEPLFYCTQEEYENESGQKSVAERIQSLFREVVKDNPTVFSSSEVITVGPRAICDVVSELQEYKLLSNLYQSQDWDLMGNAYEQYTASYLKRQQGQFFTNRLVTNFMVMMLDPDYEDIILDPAGGSGGFLTASMRYIRHKILLRESTDTAKQRQLDRHRTRLFMIEINKRLVKIAKTAMILNGDGHAGMTHGDSLGSYEKLSEEIRCKANRGKPTVILTNPPFAGVGEGRITDEKVLENFSCGMKWTEREGKFEGGKEILEDGVPPEMLFFERCLDWVAPGGKVGIVMPKSFLDTKTYLTARRLLLTKFKLLAVVNCHKNTFQPHTGVRTCLVFLYRPKDDKELTTNYPIFMAVSRKIGQDSEGIPIFKRDDNNKETDNIDHDLDDILKDFLSFKKNDLNSSEYRFSINRSDIDLSFCINPQYYLPNLNKTIKEIESIDEKDGWSVLALGQIEKGIQIYKGPRIKTENIIVENEGDGVERYYTPSAVLQEKSESAKLIQINKASKNQKRSIKALRVEYGDIVISRSGTIGRVAYITNRLKGSIVSDDMIRVRIYDETIRYYIYAFLQTESGLNQMIKNEYGSVQQHLEAKHITGIIVPIPKDWDQVKSITDAVKESLNARETMETANELLLKNTRKLISDLIDERHTVAVATRSIDETEKEE